MMTVDDCLKCEIPEGTYKLAMEDIQLLIEEYDGKQFRNEPLGVNYLEEITSLCAAFEALYELAKNVTQVLPVEYGQEKERKRILAIVDDVVKQDPHATAFILRELKRRIEEVK